MISLYTDWFPEPLYHVAPWVPVSGLEQLELREQFILQQNKSVPDWTDHETITVSFKSASDFVMDPLNLPKTACRVSHAKARLFQILILLLHLEGIASPRSLEAECLNPGLILS